MDRRRAWIVAVVLLAVTVVALASTAGIGDGRARSASDVTDVVATVLEAGVIVFAVVMVGVMAWLFLGERPRGERRAKRPMWPTLVGFTIAAIVLWIAGPIRPGEDTIEDDTVAEPGIAPGAQPEADGRDPDPPGWGLGAAGLAVMVLAAGAVVLVARRRTETVVVDVPVAPATPEERDDAIAIARACNDPRESVLLAFAAAEAILSRDPATRRPRAGSAREWAAAVRIAPLDELVGRYEIARFSQHDVTEGDRTIALASIEALAATVTA